MEEECLDSKIARLWFRNKVQSDCCVCFSLGGNLEDSQPRRTSSGLPLCA